MNGYIPISRKLFETQMWEEKRQYSKLEAWLDLIQQARFEEGIIYIGYDKITLRRGELLASLRFLAQRWDWSKNKVASYLAWLEKEMMITKRTDKQTRQTIVMLCKYEQYNYSGVDQETQKRSTKGQRRDGEGTKYNKEEIKKTNIYSLSPTQNGEIDTSDDAINISAPPYTPPVAAPPPKPVDQVDVVCGQVVDCRVDVDLLNVQYRAKGQPRADAVIRVVPEKCRTPQEVWAWLDKFTDELKVKGEQAKTMGDFQSHFINWLKLQKNGKQQNNGASGAGHLQKYGDTSESEQSIMQDMQRLSGFSSKKVL